MRVSNSEPGTQPSIQAAHQSFLEKNLKHRDLYQWLLDNPDKWWEGPNTPDGGWWQDDSASKEFAELLQELGVDENAAKQLSLEMSAFLFSEIFSDVLDEGGIELLTQKASEDAEHVVKSIYDAAERRHGEKQLKELLTAGADQWIQEYCGNLVREGGLTDPQIRSLNKKRPSSPSRAAA